MTNQPTLEKEKEKKNFLISKYLNSSGATVCLYIYTSYTHIDSWGLEDSNSRCLIWKYHNVLVEL